MRTFAPLCLLLLSAASMGCKNQEEDMGSDQDEPQYFPTAEEAVKRAKEDLLVVLRASPDLRLGVDQASLVRAQPGAAAPRFEVDFSKLLTQQSAVTLDSLVLSQRTTVVPLVDKDSVLTVVEVAQEQKGWRVSGLGGKDLADEFQTVRRTIGPTGAEAISIYEVPNLQARIYRVRRNGTESLFTNYTNRFTLSRSTTAAALIPVLRADAQEFQRKYGEALKKQRLVR